MNDLMNIISIPDGERTPEQRAAVITHERIVQDTSMVVVGLSGLGRDLKEMRDMKYYAVLGYEDFGKYTEEAHGIGARQAYKYIRVYEQLGADFLNASSKIGVTKLLELASLDREEREELLAAHSVDELADMSTEEVRRLTDEVKKLKEQLSFFEALNEGKTEAESEPSGEPEDGGAAELTREQRERLEAELREELEAEYAEKINELESKAMSDEALKAYGANAAKEAKAAAQEEIKALKAELKTVKEEKKTADNARKTAEEARKTAEDRLSEAEETEKAFAELKARAEAAEAEKAAMEKQIKLSADPEYTRFKFMFEDWQAKTAALSEQLGKVDEDKRAKLKGAINGIIGRLFA